MKGEWSGLQARDVKLGISYPGVTIAGTETTLTKREVGMEKREAAGTMHVLQTYNFVGRVKADLMNVAAPLNSYVRFAMEIGPAHPLTRNL